MAILKEGKLEKERNQGGVEYEKKEYERKRKPAHSPEQMENVFKGENKRIRFDLARLSQFKLSGLEGRRLESVIKNKNCETEPRQGDREEK